MIWLITNHDRPGADAERAALREQHRAYLKAHPDIVILSGPLQNDDGSAVFGSVFLLQLDSAEAARAFSAAEPFTAAGLYERTTITRMLKGVWNPQAMA